MEDFIEYISSPRFVLSLLTIIITVVIWIIVGKLYKRVEKYNNSSDLSDKKSSILKGIFVVIRCVLIVLCVLLVLQINGINVTSLIAGLGIVSAVIGLALQDFLKDVIMGVNIMTDRFFSVGDVIKYKNIEGEVVSFTLKATKIRTLYNDSILTVSNRNISEIVKVSDEVIIDIPISYDEDSEKVDKFFEHLAGDIRKKSDVKDFIYKGLQDFSESSLIYRFFLFCDPLNKANIRRSVLKIINTEIRKANIKIPYNQIDVHHYSEK